MKNKIYVFDFDQTITIRHTGGCVRTKEKVPEAYINGNVKSGFKEVVEYLAGKNFGIYIASLSDDRLSDKFPDSVAGHDLIERYIQTVFGENQTFFTFPEKDEEGRVERYGNVIAKYSLDFKEYHLGVIADIENLNINDPDDLKHIVFIDDDVENVAYCFNMGCTILDQTSCQKSANMARSQSLFHMMLKDFGIY